MLACDGAGLQLRQRRRLLRLPRRAMRVIGYCRVSTAEQEYGVEAQRTKIQAEADARGWDVEWIEDAGKSGKDIDREGITRALAMLRTSKPMCWWSRSWTV
jgi:Resolvase, N terminal domain